MKYRKLRIAWSVAWGIVSVLLIVLWVRSFYYLDSVQLPLGGSVSSVGGRVLVCRSVGLMSLIPDVPFPDSRFGIMSAPLDTFSVTSGSGGAVLPFWSIALLSAVMMTAFWLPDRFSLRTLLIATTLVAVGLGVLVYVARN